ncbi:MAG: SGNH/GDSL hydrolase family protein [bacterium]|nr:SGNH/GDSL hydrolase family protein [bacterium]
MTAKLKKTAFFISYNLVIVIVIFLALEYICLVLNKKSPGGGKPYFFVDPHLGYSHGRVAEKLIYNRMLEEQMATGTRRDALKKVHRIPGFFIYGNPDLPNAIRIFTLGGSTTDAREKDNWSKFLYILCCEADIPVVVYNGGISGYTSSQEMLKLIRDVLPLHPDIVISLNGVNDIGFLVAVKDNPLVSLYQKRLTEHLVIKATPPLFPNIVIAFNRWRKNVAASIQGVNFGPDITTSPAQNWEQNVRIMHSISKEFGFQYISFLQPLMGYGKYNMSAEDKPLLSIRGEGYLNLLHEFYNEAGMRLQRNSLPFVVDITDIFEGKTALYRDAKHPNGKGYFLIAEAVFKQLTERGFLRKSPKPNLYNNNRLHHWHDFYTGLWEKLGAIEVTPNCTTAPDGSSNADKITFNGKSHFLQSDNIPVREGDEVRGSIWLWAKNSTSLRLSISRHKTPRKYEGTTKILNIVNKPKRFRISHTFERNAGSARLQLYSPKGIVEVYAWGAQLYRVEKEGKNR